MGKRDQQWHNTPKNGRSNDRNTEQNKHKNLELYENKTVFLLLNSLYAVFSRHCRIYIQNGGRYAERDEIKNTTLTGGDSADDLWIATQTVSRLRSTAVGSTQTSRNDLYLGVPYPW